MANKTHKTTEINKRANKKMARCIKQYTITVFVTLLCLTIFYIIFILLYERRLQLHVDFKHHDDRSDWYKEQRRVPPWYKEEELIRRTQNCDEYFKRFPVLAIYNNF